MKKDVNETIVAGVDSMGRIQIPPKVRRLLKIMCGKGVKDDRLFRVTIEEIQK